MPASWTSRGSVLIRLARQHFAFYRGYLDGLDLRLLAERYPGGETMEAGKGSGAASGRALLGWISQQLVIEAERVGQRSAARLLRMGPLPTQMAQQHAGYPTLAEFQEERDPYHMYSERELLELFEQEYRGRAGSADRLAERNRRLRRRQEALLQRIENHARLEPSLDDPVSAWIDPGLAHHLGKAEIRTLRALLATIEAYGFHWYRKVPRIGIKAARHITAWLLLPSTREALGVSLSARGTTPPRQIEPSQLMRGAGSLDIVPLERLALPDALSGMAGANRGAATAIAATNDIEAIQSWLMQMKPGSHTMRACRKEAERFLLWCIFEAGKPLSSVCAADGPAYLRFLSELGSQTPDVWAQGHRVPQDRWLGPRGIDRWSARWRPFEGCLSFSSQRAAFSLLKGLTRFLHATGYWRTDPLLCVRFSPSKEGDGSGTSRRKAVLQDEWTAAFRHLQSQPSSPQRHRIRVLLLLLKETGCRLQQLASLRREALWCSNGRWTLRLQDKDFMERAVVLTDELRDALLENYRCHGFVDLSSVPPLTPLLTAVQGETKEEKQVKGLSGSRVYRLIKDFFGEVADAFEQSDADLARRLRRISADSFLYLD